MGSSWEGMCLEQILIYYPEWTASFFRTSNGSEIDLVLERKGKVLAFEFKASRTPKLSKGFYYSIDQLQPDATYVVAPVSESYPIDKNIRVVPLADVLFLEL